MEIKVIDYVLQNCKETILEKNKMLNVRNEENWNSFLVVWSVKIRERKRNI